MSAAKHDCQLSVDVEEPPVQEPISTLTPAQEKEMRSMGAINDGTILAKEAVAKMRSSLSWYKKGMVVILALLVMSWLGSAGLMATVFQLSKDLKVENGALKNMNGDAVSTHHQKNVYQVTLVTHADHVGKSPVVAQVSCSNVLLAIASMQNGDDESLVEIAVGNGDVWEPRMSAASFHVRDQSFGIEQVYLDDQRTTSYDVNCEMSKAACEGAPDTLCDATTVLDDLSFDDAFDGDQDKASRRRLNPAKEAAQPVLSEAYKNSANGNSASNTVGDLCALVPHSAWGGVAKLCEDLSDVGLDESVYCGHEVVTEVMAGQVLEPSFTMREVLGSDDLEQTYTAVVDRCQGTTGRRQMSVFRFWLGRAFLAISGMNYGWEGNYGWCSTAAGLVVGLQSDKANYCDPSHSEAYLRWEGSGFSTYSSVNSPESQSYLDDYFPFGRDSPVSKCCVEHDKCLNCDKNHRCPGSSRNGGECDAELAQCAWGVNCARRMNFYDTCSRVCKFWPKNWGCSVECHHYPQWAYRMECLIAATEVTTTAIHLPNNGHNCPSPPPPPPPPPCAADGELCGLPGDTECCGTCEWNEDFCEDYWHFDRAFCILECKTPYHGRRLFEAQKHSPSPTPPEPSPTPTP